MELMIASILENSNNLVALEPNTDNLIKLIENREINGFQFHVEDSSLSKVNKKRKNDKIKRSDILFNGYVPVKIIDLKNLIDKYYQYDALVCDSQLFNILHDFPDFLNNVKLLVLKNNYEFINHKQFVNQKLIENGFKIKQKEKGGFGCCFTSFYEIWIRN